MFVKNQEIICDIVGLTHQGFGVGKYKDFTFFIQGALPGEQVRAVILKVKKSYGYAKCTEYLKKSADRVLPRCEHFEKCGGCQLQHLSYEQQLKWKQNHVKENFKKIASLTDIEVLPTLGMENPWHYRNKSQLPFGYQHGVGTVAGFYAFHSHRIINLSACSIQPILHDEIVHEMKQITKQLGISIYQEETGKGFLRQVLIRTGFSTHETMVVIVGNGTTFPYKEEWISLLTNKFPTIKSIYHNINLKKTNTILGPKMDLIFGQDVIYDQVGDLSFAISPHSFFQINPKQTKVLYDKVKEYAQLTGNEVVIDAYCGTGTIGLYLASQAKKVMGVEIVEAAIHDAKRNAKLNQISHAHFEAGKAEEIIPKWMQERNVNPDVLILDPPRKGCDQELLDAILKVAPKKIVYVSCDSATLARDVKILSQGFKLEKIQPVDMFPHTSHVEVIVRLVSKGTVN